jgi:leukotriene-A4 hydrolase
MENPNSITVTPTLLAGDRSLEDVIAHELAHSWTGDLVTNANWEHFWLNEGWTRWFEMTIMADIAGDDRYFDLRQSLGYESLKDDVDRYVASGEGSLSCLVPPLKGVDPDDAFSSVPYEKGCALLRHLELLVGKEPFRTFFRAYVGRFAARTVTSHAFREFVGEHFQAAGLGEKIEDVEWEEWFVSEGMPPIEPNFDLTIIEPVSSWRDPCSWASWRAPKWT